MIIIIVLKFFIIFTNFHFKIEILNFLDHTKNLDSMLEISRLYWKLCEKI